MIGRCYHPFQGRLDVGTQPAMAPVLTVCVYMGRMPANAMSMRSQRGRAVPPLHRCTGVMVAYIDEDVLDVVKLATGGLTWVPHGKNVRADGF